MKTALQWGKGQFCRIRFYELKRRCFRSKFFSLSAARHHRSTIFCITAILVSGNCSLARDHGVHGTSFPIEESDPLVLIQSKLKGMEMRGELERHNSELQKKTKAGIERPKPVEGISKVTVTRVFYYDPTYVVQEDLKDHLGRIFYKKGTKINPLETVSLSQNLLFFDGDDEKQVAFVKEKLQEMKGKDLNLTAQSWSEAKTLKIILIKGAPLALSEELQVPVYFDQNGALTKKLGIQHVLSLVTQTGLRLRIEEIPVR